MSRIRECQRCSYIDSLFPVELSCQLVLTVFDLTCLDFRAVQYNKKCSFKIEQSGRLRI